MPKPPPLPDWSGRPAYIIGGGKSLRHFDFFQLIDRNVIGCNQAFLEHPDVVDIALFGDPGFWQRYAIALAAFPGWVATNRDDLQDHNKAALPRWLKIYKRVDEGWGTGETLAFNYNTGALAVNLAASLGATRIYLLGFDMQPNGHWHGRSYEPPQQASHYNRFKDGFGILAEAIRAPNVLRQPIEVINVSEPGVSQLAVFPVVPFSSANLVAPTNLEASCESK